MGTPFQVENARNCIHKVSRSENLWLTSHAPRRRGRFLGRSIDGMFFQHAHPFLDRAFELWIVTGDNLLRPILDIHIGGDSFILDGPTIVARKETTTRRNRRSAVNKCRRVGSMDQPAPGALAYEQSDLSIMKHVGHQV